MAYTRDQQLPADTEARLAGFTELIATAIANAEGQAALAASRARIVATADQARRRIERDLHDGAQQRLVSLALHLRAVQAAVPPAFGGHPTDGRRRGRPARSRTCARPPAASTRRSWPRAVSAPPSGHSPAAPPSPSTCGYMPSGGCQEPVKVSAYYVVAEALTNAAERSRASAVSVEVEVAGEVLRVAVRDDGCGGADFTGGTGLVASRTGWRRSAAGSSSTARGGREPVCVWSFRSPGHLLP